LIPTPSIFSFGAFAFPDVASGMKKLFAVVLVAGALVGGWWFKEGAATIDDLLTRNEQLKEAISNLTKEERIGYAKVVRQEKVGGMLKTTIRFVEIARDDQTRLSDAEFTVDGDVLYFDGMVVVFPKELVMDGSERAIFLWRRIFGEQQEPIYGLRIGKPGEEPARYREFFEKLNPENNEIFWEAIWSLANDAEGLDEYGIQTIQGEAISQKMVPGIVYTFILENTGLVRVDKRPDI
jgi:hypothetical protein